MRRRLTVLVIGLLALGLLLAAGGTTGGDWFVALPLAGGIAAWVFGSGDALSARGGAFSRVIAFTGLGLGLACALLLGGAAPSWPSFLTGPLTQIPVDRTLLVSGVMLAQLSTANVIVRLVLHSVGVPTAPGERKLKSGRVLGPMERLFIIGLGMTGAFTAAAAVVAAKGLLRYPEVKADRNATVGDRPNPVSEYFLIGSFASWLVAVAGLAVVGLP
ncbi:hypothetical protein [Myceligenerans crystallogenes]